MKNEPKVLVIGAGVSSITTAISLKSQGFDVSIMSRELPGQKPPQNPQFASLFPSASVIPHSVSHPELNRLFEDSQDVFRLLEKHHVPGLTFHHHFELFAFSEPFASYTEALYAFREFDPERWNPAHPELSTASGWEFQALFAEWPIYFPFLMRSAEKAGIPIENREVDLNALAELKADIIINCSGIGSSVLEQEAQPPGISRGHLLYVKDAPLLRDPEHQVVSYNVSTGTYTNSAGEAQDVYCYPRSDGWILGGSRQPGTLDEDGNWVGEPDTESSFPEEIRNLNREIILHTFGVDLHDFPDQEELIAYRYLGDRQKGLRLEAEVCADRLVIHNYGHGGAGVTLSWGCAFEILKLLADRKLSPEVSLRHFAETVVKVLS